MPGVRGALAVAACAAVGCSASSALAQVPGLPVWRPLAPPGVVAEGHAAWPSSEAGAGSVLGMSIGYGEAGMALRGTLARVDPDASGAEVGWAALGRVGLAASSRSPWRVGGFAGIGGVRVRSGSASGTTYRVPVGIDAGVVIPTPFAVIDAWLAPRLDLATTDPLASSRLSARAAFATGMDLVLSSGLGVRAAYDHVLVDGPDQSTFGLGILFRFKTGY